MPIQIACPSCHKEYNLAPKYAGKRIRCQACQAVISIPADNAIVNGDAAEAVEQPAAVQAAPKTAVPAAIPTLELADVDEDAPPPKRTAAPPAKSKTWLYLLLGGGAAALLLVGLGCAGVIAAFYFLPVKSSTPVVAVATTPNPPVDPNPITPVDTKPQRPPATRPRVPPTTPKPPPPPEVDDEPTGPKLDADPLPTPLKAPQDPKGTIPLSTGRNNPVRFPWGHGPIVAVQPPGKNENQWDVWNLQNMKLLGSIPGPSGADLKLSTDGVYAGLPIHPGVSVKITGMDVYTVADGKSLRKIQVNVGNDDRLGVVEFAGPGQLLSLQNDGFGGVATVYDVKSGEQVITFKTVGQISSKSAALSPGGRYLAVYDHFDAKHPVQVYEMATGKLVRTLKFKLAPNAYYNCVALAFSPDGKGVAALFNSGTSDSLHAWDFETGKRTASHTFTPPLEKTAKAAQRYLVQMYPAPLEWLPDRSGWWAYGQLMIDHNRGAVFWNRDPEDPKVLWQRRFLDADHYATVIAKSPRERQLEIVTLPKDEIEAARKK